VVGAAHKASHYFSESGVCESWNRIHLLVYNCVCVCVCVVCGVFSIQID
jgi:hypothetical protein